MIDQVGSSYVLELAAYWQQAREDWGIEERGLAPMTVISSLPAGDRTVLAQAYRSGCEVLLTNVLALAEADPSPNAGRLGNGCR